MGLCGKVYVINKVTYTGIVGSIFVRRQHIPNSVEGQEWTRYVDALPTSEVAPVTIQYILLSPPPMFTLVNIMVMDEWIISVSFHVNRRSHSWEKRLCQTLTLKLQGQGHGSGQRAGSYSWSSILLTCFLFMSHQSDQQFQRYSYSEIWPWNNQGQGREWGRRSRSHIIPSIQPMHFLFASHQWDRQFLRYGPNSVWPWKNTSGFL